MTLALLLSLMAVAQESFSSWKAGTVVTRNDVRAYGIERCFVKENLSPEVQRRIIGNSYPKDCAVKMTDLRYLRILHCNRNGQPQLGEMICNAQIADAVLRIFRKLYEAGYRIESMQLIDDYGANDERSMSANNTSAFCYRVVNGSKSLSKHSQGLAIDINPLTNPCVHITGKTAGKVEPASGKAYARNRNSHNAPTPMINTNDLCYRLFIAEGFKWGGAWRSKKDYQHFEK